MIFAYSQGWLESPTYGISSESEENFAARRFHGAGQGDIFERLDRCKREGKIRYYGVSLEKTEDGLVAIDTGKPDTLQVVYNILHQDPEEKLFPLAQKENIGILARVPLERGVLSGRFKRREEFVEKDWRRGVFPDEGLGQTPGGRPQTSRQLAQDKPCDVIVADAVVDTRIDSPAAYITGVDALAKFSE